MLSSQLSQTASHVALIAPVPHEHLLDACKTIEQEGKVAFGSMKWELFRELDSLREGLQVNVFIYASHTDDYPAPEVKWQGQYIGHVESRGGAHPDGMRFRPASTGKYSNDNSGHWAAFWELAVLQQVPPGKRIQLADLTGFGKKKAYGHPFVPEGPLLIEHPGHTSG